MKISLCFYSLLTVCLTSTVPASAAEDQRESTPSLSWFKGNTHVHTTNSDGDSTPGVVARWYRTNQYDFLVITDHNVRTEVTELQRIFDEETQARGRKPFLLIAGEEVSDKFIGETRGYMLHTNALGTSEVIGIQGGVSVRDVLQRCIDRINEGGALPHVNHPNFNWALTADDLYALKNVRHFEIFNGHPHVHNLGGGGVPGLEEMWDDLLSRGRMYYGLAVDDAHTFRHFHPGRNVSNPGKGWVVVRAPELTQEAILHALNSGEFYSSTGVELHDVTMSEKTLGLRISPFHDFKYTTEFFGKGGAVLKVDSSLEPSYELKENDLYVRARVTSSGGEQAWTQPLFIDDKDRTR